MMKKIILFLIISCFSFIQMSCDDFLTQEPETSATNINFWKTEQDVESAVYGLHTVFRDAIGSYTQYYRDRGILLDYLSLAKWNKSQSNDLSGYTTSSPELSWANEYKIIAQANLIIDNIARTNLSQDRYNFYLGQALYLRAYTYFQIIRLWGDAPLVISSNDIGQKGRTPWKEIASFIINDLVKAVQLLPSVDQLRDSKGNIITNKQIPCKGIANATLAHAYAWLAGFGKEPMYYTKGIEAATAVINDPNYGLVVNPEEVCTKAMRGNSKESIFEITYSELLGEYKSYAGYIAGAIQRWPIQPNTTPATKRNYRINNTTVANLYSKNDLRRTAYFKDFEQMAEESSAITQDAAYVQIWRYPIIFNDGNKKGQMKTYDANEIIFRLADIILLRAEMKAATNDLSGAKSDLNIIRQRAGVDDYTPEEGDLRIAIQLERDKELIFQCLVRYFDNMRNHTYNKNLKGNFLTLSEQDVLNGALFLPLPKVAFNNNPAMKQTVYWQIQFRI